LKNKLFLNSTTALLLFSFPYYLLGSGRTLDRPFANVIVERLEQKTESGLSNVSMSRKAQLLGGLSLSAFFGPATYWASKPHPSRPSADFYGVYSRKEDELLTIRDGPMIEEAMKYIAANPGKKTLIQAGRAHFPGMREHLMKRSAKPIGKMQYLDDYLKDTTSGIKNETQ
jgi:hypothetical protein